jgi:competence protein ComEC
VEARVRRPHNFRNPGSFDYVRYLARRQIFWTATAHPSGIQAVPGECGSPWAAGIARMRSAGLDRIEGLYGGRPYETGMMQAILFGETSRLEKVWTEQFRATGTFHAIVISGAHLAALAGIILLLFRCLPAPVWLQLLVTTVAVWTYTLVTGLAGAGDAFRDRIYVVRDRALLFSPRAVDEPAIRRGDRLPDRRSRATVRSELPAFVPGGGVHRRAGRSHPGADVRAISFRAVRLGRPRQGFAP